ncbi:MAG: dihydroorotate dehydrogenase electron transfer subunit [Deltaproteobacteria bacterium]|nr:dihydroorotate dehydrogenase electron transfer subunit [Deltaproteobacteria bacterium]
MTGGGCFDLTVRERISSSDGLFHSLWLEGAKWSYQPGQFLMLRPDWGLDPVWARPFSICDVSPRGLRVFFQTVGRGTAQLGRIAPGEALTAWGPLGRGFSFRSEEPILILAGGMGLAPFVGLIRAHGRPEMIRLVFGHRAPLEAYPWGELAERVEALELRQEFEADVAGFVLVLEREISRFGTAGPVLACGPKPFLRTVQRLCLDHGARGQISLENTMACGVGACLGCVARHRTDGLVQSCVRGPVFSVEDVDLEEGA